MNTTFTHTRASDLLLLAGPTLLVMGNVFTVTLLTVGGVL